MSFFVDEVVKKNESRGKDRLGTFLSNNAVSLEEVIGSKWYQNSVCIFPTGRIRGRGLDVEVRLCAALLIIEGIKYSLGFDKNYVGSEELPDKMGFLIAKNAKKCFLIDPDIDKIYKLPDDSIVALFVETQGVDDRNCAYVFAAKDPELDVCNVAITSDNRIADTLLVAFNYLVAANLDEVEER